MRMFPIFTAFLLAACLCSLAHADTNGVPTPNKVTIAIGPFPSDEDELTSKLAYAKALLVWAIKNGAQQTAPLGPYVPPFEAELFAREKQVAIWRELSAQRPSEYIHMKQLLAVQEAGFLPEYIWHYHRRESWSAEESGLRQREFLIWKHANLANHRPQTGIGLVVERQK
jgi:hypothetical protein